MPIRTFRAGICHIKNSLKVIVWKDPQHDYQEMHSLGTHTIQQAGEYVLIPSLQAGGAVQQSLDSQDRTIQLDNGLILHHNEDSQNPLQSLNDAVREYARSVADTVVAPLLEAHIAQTIIYQKQIMVKEWERICFLQKEISKLQHWMIATFPSTASRWIQPDSGVLVHTVGDALQIEECQKIYEYKLHFDRKINKTCYSDFPISITHDNTTRFLRIIDRHAVKFSPNIPCKSRPPITYLKDINNKYHMITADGNISQVILHSNTIKETKEIQLKKIKGFNEKLLTKSPHVLEPYTMLNIFTYVHDAIQEIKELQVEQGGGNVLLGIGRALGSTIESLAKGSSSIIRTIGSSLHDVLDGVGDLDEKVVGSFSSAATNIIQASGTAVKDSTTGFGNFFHNVLGGIGGTIKWTLLLCLTFLVIYVNKASLIRFCIPKPKSGPTQPSPNCPENQHTPERTNPIDPISIFPREETNIKELPKVHCVDVDRKNFKCSKLFAISEISLKDGNRNDALQTIVTIHMTPTQHQIKALIDTGSVVSIINKDLYLKIINQSYPINTKEENKIHLISASNHKIPITREDNITFQIADKIFNTKVIVAPNISHDLILGLPALIQMKVKLDLGETSLTTHDQSCEIVGLSSNLDTPKYTMQPLKWLCITITKTRITLALILVVFTWLLLISGYMLVYHISKETQQVRLETQVLSNGETHYKLNTNLYIHSHVEHNQTKVVTLFLEIPAVLHIKLGLPARLVLGYIPNNNTYLPFSEEDTHDTIRPLHHVKCQLLHNTTTWS